MSRDTPLPKGAICPYCGAQQDAAASFNDEVPSPGQVSLCIDCGKPSIFTEELKFRRPTEAEKIGLSQNTELLQHLLAWPLVKAGIKPPC